MVLERHLEGRGIRDPGVLEAIRSVPREQFVPPDLAAQAHGDHPVPIGYGQTISQPFIVALMTEALGVAPGDRVLEIGTGSAYQTAVLAALGVEVFSLEIVPELAAAARQRLDRLGYAANIRVGDGYRGWEEHAPFDGIVVTAAPDHLPRPLVKQLASGGRLVIPIGPAGGTQTLWRYTLDDAGDLQAGDLGAVAFVPFTGEA